MSRFWGILYWLVAAAWLGLMLTTLVWGWPIGMRFETNDDFWMLQLASGRYTGAPSEFLLYMNVAIGWLLKALFTRWPYFNSYLALFSVLHVSFWGSMVWVLRGIRHDRMGWVMLASAALLFHGWIWLRLQFTTAAFVGACGTFLLTLSLALQSEPVRARSWIGGWAVVLWILAYGVRRQAALLAALFSLPAIAYVMATHKTAARTIGKAALFGLVASLALEVNQRAYLKRHPDWAAFLRFNAARSKVHVAPGYAYDEESRRVYDHIGWSQNDVEIFQQWFFPDSLVHSPNDVEYLVRNLRRSHPLASAIHAWLETLGERRLMVAAAVFWGIGVVMSMPVLSWVWGAALMMSIGLQLYFQATARLPARVLVPMLFAPVLDLMPFQSGNFLAKRSWLFRIWMVGWFLLMGLVFRSYARMGRQHAEMADAWQQAENQQRRAGAHVLVLWADDWPVEWARVTWRLSETPGPRYVSLSSITQSPHHGRVLSEQGITNLVTALLSRDDIALVCRTHRLPHLERYVREHHGVSIRAADLGGIFSRRIYKLAVERRMETKHDE